MTTEPSLPCWHTIGVWGRDEPRCPELSRVVHCRNCGVYRSAGRRLFDREVPDTYGQQWLDAFADGADEEVGRREATLAFRLGAEGLALPLAAVVEVLAYRPIRTIPHQRDDLLLGLVNVGGVLRICVSLEVLLGGDRPAHHERKPQGRMIALGEGGPEWIVPVDDALGVVRVAIDHLAAAPATVHRSQGAYVRGLFDYRGEQVGLLDADLVLGALRRRLS
jgi:chemotaxis-related protein WspD